MRKVGASSIGTDTLHFGVQQISTTTTPRYMTPGGDAAGVAAASAIGTHVQRAGRITKITARHITAGTGSETITYTIVVDGVDAFAVAFDNETAGTFSAIGSVHVPVGALVSVRVDKSGVIAGSPLFCDIDLAFEG